MYDAFTGRFIQPDTLVPEPGSSQGYNRYTYVNNNPIMNSDPSGHIYCDGEQGCQGNIPKQSAKYPPTMSEKGKKFLISAEGGTNFEMYGDVPADTIEKQYEQGTCTVGYGYALSPNSSCRRLVDSNFMLKLDFMNNEFAIQDKLVNGFWYKAENISRHPVDMPILKVSDIDANRMMSTELYYQGKGIQANLSVDLKQNQWDAVQSLIYQTGDIFNITQAINNGADMYKYISTYGQREDGTFPNDADEYRRQAEAELYAFGDYTW